jgi:hypothetical protein
MFIDYRFANRRVGFLVVDGYLLIYLQIMKNIKFKNKVSKLPRSPIAKKGGNILTKFRISKFYLYVNFLILVSGVPKTHRTDFYKLRDRILKTYKTNGKTFTCMYLKEACRLVSKNLSGEETRSSDEPRVASRRGLPLIIPGKLRLLMEANDPKITRVVLTILSIYRTMVIPSKLKLESITDPSSGIIETIPEVPLILGYLKTLFVKEKILFLKGKSLITPTHRLLNLSSSGPQSKVQMLGYPADALA